MTSPRTWPPAQLLGQLPGNGDQHGRLLFRTLESRFLIHRLRLPRPSEGAAANPYRGKGSVAGPHHRHDRQYQRPDRAAGIVTVQPGVGSWHPGVMLPDRQLDLFDAAGRGADPSRMPADRPRLIAEALNDDDLVAAIPGASLEDCHAVTREAVRRRLGVAVSALEALCRRFRGFGLEHTVPEQVAALQALAGLGGPEAAAAVTRIIAGDVVQGPRGARGDARGHRAPLSPARRQVPRAAAPS